MRRLWLVVTVSTCLAAAGCSGGDEEQKDKKPNNQGGIVVIDPKPKKQAKPKPKNEPKKKAAPAPAFAASLRELLPDSLTVAVGAKIDSLSQITAATGTDFLAALRPASSILNRCGLVIENVDEIWVGSNPQTNDSAVCVKMKTPYDRAKMRIGLQIAQPLGKIDGKELHALHSFTGVENAVAYVDDRIFMVGRRPTIEAAMKRPMGGPLRIGLAVAQTEHAGYWVAGDAESYLPLLAHHGFPSFSAHSSKVTAPLGFAMTIPTKPTKQNQRNRPAAAKPKRAGRGFSRGDDEDEELSSATGFSRAPQQRRAAANRNSSTSPISGDSMTIVMGFAFESNRAALQMERRARTILDALKSKLEAEASLEMTLAEAKNRDRAADRNTPTGRRTGGGNSPPRGRAGGNAPRGFGRNNDDDDDDGREPRGRRQSRRRNLFRDNTEVPDVFETNQEIGEAQGTYRLQRRDDDDDPRGRARDRRRERRRNRRGDDDDDDDDGNSGRIVPRNGAPRIGGAGFGPTNNNTNANNNNRDTSLSLRRANINFRYTIKTTGPTLRIELVMSAPPRMSSIVASVMRAAGNSLTGDGIVQGSFPSIVGGLAFLSNEQQGKLRGVKRLPDLPTLAGYSWMTELLPYLNQQHVYVGFNFDKDWMTHAENRKLAGTVIPQFINPAANTVRWEGFPYDGLGLTHFVGMSGVEDGPNVLAAALDRNDPRAGIFGYDSVAKPRQMTDGASSTIMMIGSGELSGPWVQGGGATIRGAREPYFDELTGFGSAGLKKRGAHVLFADGSYREISADIDPALFRALCTIHGSEDVDLSQLNPPVGGMPTNVKVNQPPASNSFLKRLFSK